MSGEQDGRGRAIGARDESRSEATREAAAMAAPYQESTRIREKALVATLKYLLRGFQLSNYARARITEVMAQGGGVDG